MNIWLLLATSLLAYADAKKGGNRPRHTNIINPDVSGPKKTLEFNGDTNRFTEGDILRPKGDGNSNDRNAINWEPALWIAGVVPYVYDHTLGQNMRNQFQAAVNDFNKHTCVRFVERLNENDYVNVNSREEGCYANLGKMGGEQPLNLEEKNSKNEGCGQKGTVIHEMLHTIGFAHEQSRNDRNKYITIHWNNIDEEFKDQFKMMEKNQENNQGFPYDFSSVMHYPEWGFAKKGLSITTNDPSKQHLIGQRAGFSKQDIEEVNKLYHCDDKFQQPSHCRDTMPPKVCREKIREYGETICYSNHQRTVYSQCQNTCRHCRG